VRLHDAGVELILAPLPPDRRGELLTGAAPLSLVTLPGVPKAPEEALALLADLFLGPEAAQAILAQRFVAPDQRDEAALRDQEAALPILLLWESDERVWVSATLEGVAPRAGLPLDPGDLWRHTPAPDTLPSPPSP
jgi:hypothetical protein